MKVYDTFLFFNELDLLEIRLNELDDVVDTFVIVEATKTFSLKDKPLCYLDNKERFAKFSHKIKHVIVNDTPNIQPDKAKGHSRHLVEHYHRSQIDTGVADCEPDDLIIMSDIDEIFRPENVLQAIDILSRQKLVSFVQRFFYYYLNGVCVQYGSDSPWNGPVACFKKDYFNAQKLRDNRGTSEREKIYDAGWHFSYLGGVEKIVEKLESFAHAEFDNSKVKDKKSLEQKIAAGVDIFERPNRPTQKYIKIDSTFPKYVQNNLTKFSHLIKEVR